MKRDKEIRDLIIAMAEDKQLLPHAVELFFKRTLRHAASASSSPLEDLAFAIINQAEGEGRFKIEDEDSRKRWSSPIRKVIARDGDIEHLECGHEKTARPDLYGDVLPESRRCNVCRALFRRKRRKHAEVTDECI